MKTYSSTSFKTFALTGIKLFSVVVLLVAAPNAWADMFHRGFYSFVNKGLFIYAMGYAAIFWASILALFIVPFLRNAYVRVPLVTLIIMSYAVARIYSDLTDFHLNFDSLWVVWFERAIGLTALPFYANQFFRSCWWVVGAGILMALPPGRNCSLRLRWSAIPLSALALVSSIIPYTKGGTQEFPPTFALPVMFEMVATTPMGSIEPAAEVEYGYTIRPLAKHIVFIVDESVRGDMLEINDPKLRNTPFLAQQKDRIVNFGVAVAPANCSFTSRTILRLGLQPEDFGNSGLSRPKRPLIWKYAREAGFRTIMIDALDERKYFSPGESTFIDMYLPETTYPAYMRDGLVAERLVQLLKEDSPSFIYVNKFGTHFPYQFSYPPDLDNLHLPPENWTHEELLHMYNNAILWSVDGFFKKLLDRFQYDNVLLVYTSDHGQRLMDGKERKSHCTTSSEHTQVGEGLVPLIVSTGIPELEVRLRESAPRLYNRASGFDIFSTLLLAMGYNEQWVRTSSGPTLLDASANRKRRFLRSSPLAELFDKPSWFPAD